MEGVMIPEEKSAAVERGLREAFGVTAFEDIRRVTGGHTTSLVFRIVVGGSPFLLKIIMRTDDPTRHFTSMKTAAEGGVAPRVRYTSIEDRILITDFVEAERLAVEDALVRIPRALRALHALPPFARVPDHINTSCMFLMNKGPALDGFIGKFQAAALLPEAESAELFARYAQVAAVYARHDADMVSSHNDLFKPDNILFDGDRIWLVDWEAAFLNDRYADLAVASNYLVTNEAEEKIYLQEYFGQPPDPYQLARFFLMQQLNYIFYAMAHLYLGSLGRAVNQSGKAPAFRDFHRRMWAGEVDLGDKETKSVYGRVHLEHLLQNTSQARLDEALRIVSERHACA
jgi:thiamine kinase-like enzyme